MFGFTNFSAHNDHTFKLNPLHNSIHAVPTESPAAELYELDERVIQAAERRMPHEGRGWGIPSFVRQTPSVVWSAATLLPRGVGALVQSTASIGKQIVNKVWVEEGPNLKNQFQSNDKRGIAESLVSFKSSIESNKLEGEVLDPSAIINILKIAQDNLVAIHNSKGEEVSVPYQFSIDGPRSKFFIDATLLKSLKDGNQEDFFAFCKTLINKYGETGFINISSLLTQTSLADLFMEATLKTSELLGKPASLSQLPGAVDWNIWEDQGNVHIKCSIIFDVREMENPENFNSFTSGEIDIIIPKSDISQKWSMESQESPEVQVICSTRHFDIKQALTDTQTLSAYYSQSRPQMNSVTTNGSIINSSDIVNLLKGIESKSELEQVTPWVPISNSKGEQMLIPAGLATQQQTFKYYVDSKLESESGQNNQDAFFDFCKTLKELYGETSFKNLSQLLDQQAFSSTFISLQEKNPGKLFNRMPNSSECNIWEDNEGKIHIKYLVAVESRDVKDLEFLESCSAITKEIIIPRYELEKEWSQDSKELPKLQVKQLIEDIPLSKIFQRAGVLNLSHVVDAAAMGFDVVEDADKD